jgi:hypothetical protein
MRRQMREHQLPQWRGRRSPVGAAAVADLTDLLAGGVRNRKIAEPEAFAADPCPGGVGANPADRLVATQWDGSSPNLRPTGYPVLGQ